MRLIAGTLLLLVMASAAFAQSAQDTILREIQLGNGLYQALQGCHASKTPLENRNCFIAWGYVSGVADNDNNILPPSGIVWQQMFDVVEDYLAKHPEKRQLTSVVLIKAACKEVGWWKN